MQEQQVDKEEGGRDNNIERNNGAVTTGKSPPKGGKRKVAPFERENSNKRAPEEKKQAFL